MTYSIHRPTDAHYQVPRYHVPSTVLALYRVL